MDFFKSKNYDPVRARLLYDTEGNSKGTGFVEMSSEGEREEAVAKLNGEMFKGWKISVAMPANKN
jgi:RNA recognition motif-containing protein